MRRRLGRDLLGRAHGDRHAALLPALGPHVDQRSAHLITSRLCSITTTLLPASTSRCEHLQQPLHVGEVQARGGLVEDVERAPVAIFDSSVASFTRWASPPDSVVAGWPRRT